MSKIGKLLYFENSHIKKLDDIMKRNNSKSQSDTIRQVLDTYDEMQKDKELLSKILLEVIDNKKIIIIILRLLKQLYSDMEFEIVTDINKSKNLNLILKSADKIIS